MSYLDERRRTGASLASYVVATIDRLRQERGWTKRRLAEEVGVDESTMSQILRGVRPFSFDMAERIFGALE